ncbi:OB-fold protein [Achromobacter animicus]
MPIVRSALLGAAAGLIALSSSPLAHAQDRQVSAFSAGKAHKYPLSPLEYQVFEALLEDDATGFAEGRDSQISQNMKIVYASSADLSKAYSANEVAADRSYKGKTLFVTGKIASINSGIGGAPYFVLGAQIGSPQAKIQKDFIDFAAAAKKGQSVQLVCSGSGATLGAPMLSDCKPAAKVAVAEAVKVARQADKALGGYGSDESAQRLLIASIAAASGLKDGDCDAGSAACLKKAVSVLNAPEVKERAAKAKTALRTAGVKLTI